MINYFLYPGLKYELLPKEWKHNIKISFNRLREKNGRFTSPDKANSHGTYRSRKTGGLIKMNKRTKQKIELVVEAIKAITGFGYDELIKRSRGRDIDLARALGYYFLYEPGVISHTVVGAAFHRDHTTSVVQCKAVQDWLDVGDKGTIEAYEKIRAFISNSLILEKNIG
jgi:hypothetical protein